MNLFALELPFAPVCLWTWVCIAFINSPDIFCIYPLCMEKLRRSTSLRVLITHNKREVLLNNFDVPVQGSLTEGNKKLSTWLVCYTGKKEILKPFRFSSSQFQYDIVDVSVVQAFLVKRNRKLLAISGYRAMPASTKSLVHIHFCSFSWPVE